MGWKTEDREERSKGGKRGPTPRGMPAQVTTGELAVQVNGTHSRPVGEGMPSPVPTQSERQGFCPSGIAHQICGQESLASH